MIFLNVNGKTKWAELDLFLINNDNTTLTQNPTLTFNSRPDF